MLQKTFYLPLKNRSCNRKRGANVTPLMLTFIQFKAINLVTVQIDTGEYSNRRPCELLWRIENAGEKRTSWCCPTGKTFGLDKSLGPWRAWAVMFLQFRTLASSRNR